MADLSLGPLRIANPDDSSAEAFTPVNPFHTRSPDRAISPFVEGTSQDDYLAIPRRSGSPVSPLASSPYGSTPDLSSSRSPPVQQYAHRQRPVDRHQQRQALPMSFQEQQQAQFPQYPATMPQNLHDPRTNSNRPSSTYYTQVSVNSPPSNGVSRHNSGRVLSGGSGYSIPKRSGSARAGLADPAGLAIRDDGQYDRMYGSGQNSPNPSSGQFRQSSRGGNSSRAAVTGSGSTPSSGTPVASQTPLSGSPYTIDRGPLSGSEDRQSTGGAPPRREHGGEGRPRGTRKGVKDFIFNETLGEGSYSTVLAAKDRANLKEYAIKVLDKRHIIKEKKVKYVNIEKDTLNRLTDHPGVVRLYYTFQDDTSLYFVLDLCTGGELLGVLKRMSTFDEECTRFYGAQILDTIEYMHGRGVIHRDLKPENILLDSNMYIKITDFGTAKLLKESKDSNGRSVFEPDTSAIEDRANSFVGTAEYVSPELLTDKNACKASDLWAFGCIIYQLLAGRPPFKAANEYLTFQKIVALEYEFPRGFPPAAQDLVERLLVLDPMQRLSLSNVKTHEFFTGVTWGKVLWTQKAPRLKAYVPPSNPINLNGSREAYPIDLTPGHSTQATMLPPVTNRQGPRAVAELPAPSPLDIEWAPVLTRNNERILKLGNLAVTISTSPNNPGGNESGGAFSRLFGGNNSKKRPRLVIVTSSARVIITAAGGEEKKAKSEINLLSPGTEYLTSADSKGMVQWIVVTREKQFIFEDIKQPSNDAKSTAASAQEWLDALVRARDVAIAQQQQTTANFSGGDDGYDSSPRHGTDLEQPTEIEPPVATQNHSPRAVLQKPQATRDADSLMGRKRFSKRQSKSGLTAVF